MNSIRLPDILLYEFVDLIPYLALAFVPFSRQLRFSRGVTGAAVAVLYLLLSASRLFALGSLTAATWFTVFWIGLYLVFYQFCSRAELTKLLFVLLTILNYASFVTILYSYIAFHRMTPPAQTPYASKAVFVKLFVMAFSYPEIYILMAKKIRPLVGAPENNRVWRLLWMVPAVFCLSYYYNLFANGGILLFSKKWNNVLFAAAFNAGACFVTYLVSRLVEESNYSLRLKAENDQLTMQTIQYENLKNRMEEARRARHDMRQIMTVIQSYLQKGDLETLSAYVNQYAATLPSDAPIVYCDSFALNALFVYYESIASKHQIRFQASVEYPPDCQLADTDAVVLFGNLLENALEACRRHGGANEHITLCVRTLGNSLVILLDNSYDGVIHRAGDMFLSSKTDRAGIGISSVRKIAEKYQGTAKFEYDEKEFHASVFIYYK